jgi:lauroyl/myristoyl acyltransferase
VRQPDIVRIVQRRRNFGERVPFQLSDLATACSLAVLAPLSWLLPEGAWPPVCSGIAALSSVTDRTTFRRTREHIQRALPNRSATRIALALQAAVYELRMQNLRAWRPGGWRPPINLEGQQHLDQALAQGRGAILWVAHFAFNSNIVKIALHRRGNALLHLSRPEHGFSKTRFGVAFLNPIRCFAEDSYLAERVVFDRKAPAGAMRKLYRALQAGKAVSITAGAWEGADLGEGPLFDGKLSVALGAPKLAVSTGAALLPVFAVRHPMKGLLTTIEPPLRLDPGIPAKDMLHAVTLEYLTRHERWISQFPEQWRGWKEWQPLPDLVPSRDAPRLRQSAP